MEPIEVSQSLFAFLMCLFSSMTEGEDVALGHVGIGEALAGEVGPGLVIGADGEDPRLSHIRSHQSVLPYFPAASRS